MNSSSIKSVINNKFDQWIDLSNFRTILLANDGRVSPGKYENQFYFDSSNELMFVRHTFPYLFDSKKNEEFIEFDGGFLRPIQGGVVDSVIGRYHEVFTFDSIVLFG